MSISKWCKLSNIQNRLWFDWSIAPNSCKNNTYILYKLSKSLNAGKLQKVIKDILKTYPVFRTQFSIQEDGKPKYRIINNIIYNSHVIEIPHEDGQSDLDIIMKHLKHPIDLLQFPNYKILLFHSKSSQCYYFAAMLPHILIDATSCELILSELSQGYNNKFYKIKSYSSYFNIKENIEDKQYWQNKLQDCELNLSLVTSNEKKEITNITNNRIFSTIKKEELSDLKTWAKANRSTHFLAVLTIYTALLYRYTQQTNISFLYPVDMRTKKNKQTIGCHINLFPMNIILNSENTLSELLHKITQQRKSDRKHQFISSFSAQSINTRFAAIVSKTLFGSSALQLNSVAAVSIPVNIGTVDQDLALLIDFNSDNLTLCIDYNEVMYDQFLIQQILNDCKNIITHIAFHSEATLSNYPLIRHDSLQLSGQQNKKNNYLRKIKLKNNVTLYSKFQENVKKYPNQNAISDEYKTLSYSDLATQVKKLSNYLALSGVKRKSKVAIALPADCWYVTTILSLCNLQCTYIPLDIKLMPKQVEWILNDSKAEFIIVDKNLSQLIDHASQTQPIILNTHEINQSLQPIESMYSEPKKNNAMDNIIYIIYTSGTTGKPKGIPITEVALLNLFYSTENFFSFDNNDRWSLSHTFAFDFSVWEMWGALLYGGHCIIAPPHYRQDPNKYYNFIIDHQITVLNITPSAFQNMSMIDNQKKKMLCLRCIIFGGEALHFSMLETWMQNHGYNKPKLINMYGLTEAPIHATYYKITEKDRRLKAIPIGFPLPGLKIILMDQQGLEVPVGAKGEIWISSHRLTKGYLSLDQLNQNKFIEKKIAGSESNQRFLKTGDYAFQAPTGDLIYLGRDDQQVQFYGYRIELGGINRTLLNISSIAHAVSILYQPDAQHKHIVTFCIVQDEKKPAESTILNYLSTKLPYYMIPSCIIFIPSIPITKQGKVNTSELQDLAKQYFFESTQQIEKSHYLINVTRCWERILGITITDKQSNFFDLGGDSIKLSQLHYQLSLLYGNIIPLASLFHYPTIHSQANYIADKFSNRAIPTINDSILKTNKQIIHTTDSPNTEEIAIIGLSCQLPMVKNIADLWNQLHQGKELLTKFSLSELEENGIKIGDSTQYIPIKGYVKNSDKFDANFFDYSKAHAAIIDPQHRLFLQNAWNALEDAGYVSEEVAGKIGVFASQSYIKSYLHEILERNHDIKQSFSEYQRYIENSMDSLAPKISYKLNLTGPSTVIQSGCSSSLVAIAQACDNLLNKNCDLALAGGVCLTFPLKSGYEYIPGMIFSPDGHCKPFDTKANGTVPGNGVGIVVLKRLSEALKDNDNIYAVIKSAAVNNDGHDKMGFTSPSIQGQIRVITEALRKANCESHTIDYIEAHGTGTPLGDPIELDALNQILNSEKRHTPCKIGSIKANIGHLDAAAGVAGLIKTVLCLKYKAFLPQINFQTMVSNEINLEKNLIEIITEPQRWAKKEHPRRAGVSAFAIGGTNAHIILEEPPKKLEPAQEYPPVSKKEAYIFSAKSKESLINLLNNYYLFLKDKKANLSDIAHALQTRRATNFPYRAAYIAEDRSDLLSQLSIKQDPLKCQIFDSINPIFIFDGVVAGNAACGRYFYDHHPAFKKAINQCADIFQKESGYDIRFNWNGENHTKSIAAPHTTWHIFSYQYALAKLLINLGITPSACYGYGLGEYVAATVTESWPLEFAINLLIDITFSIKKNSKFKLLRINSSIAKLNTILPNGCMMITTNYDSCCIVAGENATLQQLEDLLLTNNINYSRLAMEAINLTGATKSFLSHWNKRIAAHILKEPIYPILSGTTNKRLIFQDISNPNYWVDQLSHPINLNLNINLLNDFSNCTLMQIGSHCKIISDKSTLKYDCHFVKVTSGDEEEKSFLNCLIALWLLGCNVYWGKLSPLKKASGIPLPTYPFNQQSYLIKPSPNNSINFHQDFFAYELKWKPCSLTRNIPSAQNSKSLIFVYTNDENILLESISKFFKNIFIFSNYAHLERYVSENKLESNINIIFLLSESRITDTRLEWHKFEEGYKKYFSLFTEIHKLFLNNELHMTIVVSEAFAIHSGEHINPLHRTLVSLLQTAEQEWQRTKISIVDTPFNMENAIANNFIHAYQIELTDTLPIIALRKKSLYHLTLSKMMSKEHEPFTVRENGTYLITGGCGHLGLTLAEVLVKRQPSITLILLQRRSLSPQSTWETMTDDKMIARLYQLKKQCTALILCSLDLSNADQVDLEIQKLSQQVTRISGIIHAAGIPAGGMISSLTLESIQLAFSAKVKGTLNLHNSLIKYFPEEADFWVLCSALSSFRCDIGQALYNSANAFLDAFATWRTYHYGYTIALNWDTLHDGGMAKIASEKFGNLINIKDGLTDKQIKEHFLHLINSGASQLILTQNKNSNLLLPKQRKKPKDNIFHHTKSIPIIQKQLKEIWSTYLGANIIDFNSNYFDLNGDSLSAIQIIEEINKMYQIQLDPNVLLEFPTITSLSQKIDQLNTNTFDEPNNSKSKLITLKKHGFSKKNIFLIHPIGGTVYIYRDLSQHISDTINVYGLQVPTTSSAAYQYHTVPELALEYINIIREIQPNGPYYIGGASFGGTVAYEMSQQLWGMNHEVAGLYLIDTPCHTHLPKLSAKNEDILAYLLEVGARHNLQKNFYTMPWKQQLNYFMEHSNHLNSLIDYTDNQHVMMYLDVFKKNMRAMDQYIPKLYHQQSEIFYFKATDKDNVNAAHPEIGWQPLLHDRQLKLHDIPGTHITMLFSPNAEHIATVINKVMKEKQ